MSNSAKREPSKPSPYTGFDELLIGGEWRKGRSQRMLEDRNPYTGEALEVIKQGDRDDLNDAYFAALEAHPHWASELPLERAGVMRRAAETM
jgi:aldehyde dehydrogenase (NAD+)